MKILGIDEAGKGPVCGPLVICGYLVDSDNLETLRKTGVKDSKLLSSKKRNDIVDQIRKVADDFVVLKIPAENIDRLRTKSNLNKIELERMAQIINIMEPDRIVVDAFEYNATAFGKKLQSRIKNKTAEIIAENFADRNHIEVGAASVIAKVERDAEIEKLHKKYGPFGSGYPSDETTVRFLKDWIEKNKEFPPFVRKSWITAKLLVEGKQQRKLVNFA